MDGYCLAQLFEENLALAAREGEVVVNDRHVDDAYCWICGAAIIDVHCKIVCHRCGFMRDCSDP